MDQPLELTVVMYHYVRDPGDAAETGSGIPGLPTAHFDAQLDLLADRYTIVDWPTVRAHLLGQAALPPRACTLTFDDGLCDHYLNVFPRLRARGLSGLFFALARPRGAGLPLPHQLHFLIAALGVDQFRERLEAALDPATRQHLAAASTAYLTGPFAFARGNPPEAFRVTLQRELAKDAAPAIGQLFAAHIGPERNVTERLFLLPAQVREMLAGGMHFGGHSATHPWLDFADDDALAREAAGSADWLAGLAPGPFAFAYPFGGFDERTPAALARAGFCAAFTTRAQVRHGSAFHIGRLDGEWLPPAGEGDAAFLLEARHA